MLQIKVNTFTGTYGKIIHFVPHNFELQSFPDAPKLNDVIISPMMYTT